VRTLAYTGALVLLLTAAAQAKNKHPYGNPKITTLPPIEYDVPYTGELTIWITDKKDIREHCARAIATGQPWAGIACAAWRKDKSRCIIYIVKDDVVRAAGYHPNVVLRHEMGHCNGWSGSDHAGGRKIRADAPVPMPELPKTTLTIKAYLSASACIKPDGTEESCESRQPRETREASPKTPPLIPGSLPATAAVDDPPKDGWAQPWAVEDVARKREEAKNRPDLTEEQRQTIEQAEDHDAVVKRIWLQCRPSSPGCVN
jgi:hypothetical protein